MASSRFYGNQSHTLFQSVDIKHSSLVTKLVNCTSQITVSSKNGMKSTTIQELLVEARKAKRAIVFTFTPGPFKSAEELPSDWMTTPAAVGCSAQLSAFEKAMKELKADIYAINKQTSGYQCGSAGLLAAKGFDHLQMISDAEGLLEKELDLPTFEVNGKRYLNRFSVVIKPDDNAKIFELPSPVDADKAQQHVALLTDFIHSELNNQDKKEKEHIAELH
jgi:peroxiredoxin